MVVPTDQIQGFGQVVRRNKATKTYVPLAVLQHSPSPVVQGQSLVYHAIFHMYGLEKKINKPRDYLSFAEYLLYECLTKKLNKILPFNRVTSSIV